MVFTGKNGDCIAKVRNLNVFKDVSGCRFFRLLIILDVINLCKVYVCSLFCNVLGEVITAVDIHLCTGKNALSVILNNVLNGVNHLDAFAHGKVVVLSKDTDTACGIVALEGNVFKGGITLKVYVV